MTLYPPAKWHPLQSARFFGLGDSLFVLDVHDSYMLQNLAQHGDNGPPIDMPSMMEALAQNSARPRYAFMVLNLIASIAGPDGRAGPLVVTDGSAATIRDRSEERRVGKECGSTV